MFKKIISLAMSCVLLFQCSMNVSAHGDNATTESTEINTLASQIAIIDLSDIIKNRSNVIV